MPKAPNGQRDRVTLLLLALTGALLALFGLSSWLALRGMVGTEQALGVADRPSQILESTIALACLGLTASMVWRAPQGAWWQMGVAARVLGVVTVLLCGLWSLGSAVMALSLSMEHIPGLGLSAVTAMLLAPVGLLAAARLCLVARRGARERRGR